MQLLRAGDLHSPSKIAARAVRDRHGQDPLSLPAISKTPGYGKLQGCRGPSWPGRLRRPISNLPGN
jgi:hypothetical protein